MASRTATRLDWQRVRDVASRLTTPLLPDDYLQLINPLWSARELRGRVERGRPGDRRRRHAVIRPGWGWIVRPPARPVRRHRRAGRRALALALVLADLGPGPRQGHDRDHGQGDARGLPVRPPGPRPRAGHDRAARGAGRGVRAARPAAGEDPVPGRRQRHHPGDAMLRTLDRRGTMPDVVARALRAGRGPDALPRRAARTCASTHRSLPSSSASPHRRGCSASADLDDRLSRLARRGTWACGPEPMLDAAEEHWTEAGLEAQLHLERFSVEPRRRRGRGRHRHVRAVRQAGRRRRRHHPARGRRAGRHQHAVRLPDGHLPHLRRSAAPGTVRDLRNGTSTATSTGDADGRHGPDLRQRRRGDCVLDV